MHRFRKWIFVGLALVGATLPGDGCGVAWAAGPEKWGLFERVSDFQIKSLSPYVFQGRHSGSTGFDFAFSEGRYRFTVLPSGAPAGIQPQNTLLGLPARRYGLFASTSAHGSFRFSAQVSNSAPAAEAQNAAWGFMLQDPVGKGITVRWNQRKPTLGSLLSLEVWDEKGLKYRYPSAFPSWATPTVDPLHLRMSYRDSINLLHWEWSADGRTWKAEAPVALALLSPVEVGLFAETDPGSENTRLAEFRDVQLQPLESVYGERHITRKKIDLGGEEVAIRLNLYNDSRDNRRLVYEEKIHGPFQLIDIPQSPPYEILPSVEEKLSTVRWYLTLPPGHSSVDYALTRVPAQIPALLMFSSGSPEVAIAGQTGLPPAVKKEESSAGNAYRLWDRETLKIDPEFHYLSLQENGVLLLATASSLHRYDGYRFQSIPLDSEWRGMAKETPDGWLWLADWHSGHLFFIPADRRPEDRWELLSEPNGDPVVLDRPQFPKETTDWRYALSSLAYRFHPRSGGRILVLEEERLLEYDVRQKRNRILLESDRVNVGRFRHLLERPNKGICVTGETGIALGHGPWEEESASPVEWDTLSVDRYPLQDFAFPVEGSDGSLAVAAAHAQTQRHLVLRYQKEALDMVYESLYPAVPLSFLPSNEILLSEVGERRSLSYFTLRHESEIQYKKPLVFNQAFPQQVVSRHNILWMSTDQGLIRAAPSLWHQPSDWRSIKEKVIPMGQEKEGTMWLLGENYLYQYRHAPPRKFPVNQETATRLRRMQVVDSLPDGNLLLAPRFIDPATPTYLYHPALQALRPWFPSMTKRSEADPGPQRATGDTPNLPPEEGVRASWRDRQGNTWMGWGGTDPDFDLSHPLAFRTRRPSPPDREWLQRYRDGRVQALPVKYPGTEVVSLVEDDSGLIWVAGESSLYTFNGEQWSSVGADWGRITALLRAQDGKIWLASSQGVSCYSHGTWITYSREDGLEAPKVFSLWEDRQGQIWAGTEWGVYVYNASADRDPPDTFLGNQGNLREFSENSEIRFFFQGVDQWDQTMPDRLFYSYRLNEGNWSPFSSAKQASLAHLTPGSYSLQVRAMDRNWNTDASPAVHAFRVLPLPIQERAWFTPLLIIGSTVILILALIAWVSRSQLAFLARNLERLVSERTQQLQHAQAHLLSVSEHEQQRIGQDLHDDVVQEFVGIALNTELVLQDLAEKEPQAAEELSKILKKVDEATLKTRRLARGLAPVNLDRLGLVGALQSLCQDVSQFYGIPCLLHCPENLSVGEDHLRLNAFRIVQEAVHNALKHAKATRITIHFQVDQQSLQIQVQDDGIGFDPTTASEGMGLHILRYRAGCIDGRLTFHSVAGQGTLISCILPLRGVSATASSRHPSPELE